MPLIDCPHAEDIGKQSTVRCKLGRFGGYPHAGVCRTHCEFGGAEVKEEIDRSYIAEREEICAACDEPCGLRNLTNCQRAARLRRPNMCCPLDPPKWKPIMEKQNAKSNQRKD